MAAIVRCALFSAAIFLALHIVTATANNSTGGEASSGQWPFSTVPRYKMPALEARLRGHSDISFSPASKRGGPSTTCSRRAPHRCSSANNKTTICCRRACGPTKGKFVTCAPVNTPPGPIFPRHRPPSTSVSTFGSKTKLPTPPTGYVWVADPTLTDEFSGSALNLTKWRPYHSYWLGREPSQFDPANVAVKGGYALLTSTTNVTDLSQVANPLIDPWVSSACLQSVNATAGYGYYEARMKASNMNMTSSFWLQFESYEIDVIETIGSPDNPRSTKMHINTHFFDQGTDTYKSYDWSLTPIPTYTSGDFHTYSVWFKDAQNLLFYYDGQLVWDMTPPAQFTEQLYLFFDTEVFTWEGLPTVSDLVDPSRNVFSIDYVRAFTLQPAPAPAPASAPEPAPAPASAAAAPAPAP